VFLPVETGLADHHLYILSIMQRVIEGELPRAMFFLPPGSAKALALDTPIPTPSGWKKMGDLRIGDHVFDDQGQPCNVTWISPIWRDRPCYTVKTDCGDEIIADHDHEWFVRLCGKPRKALKAASTKIRHGAPARPDRDDPLSKFKIKETHDLCRRRAKRPMILRAKTLNLPQADLPIDPYLLGVWLGDGNSSGMRITSSVDDQKWLRAEIERLGYKTSDSSVATLFGVLGIRDKFVSLDLVNDPAHNTFGRKHIPQMYLRASIEQRKALLQGLIDTDGTVCKRRGCVTFCNTKKELAEQVRELVRSLGVKAGWSESRAKINGKDCGPAYKVSFYLKGSARLPRKAVLCRNQTRTPNTYIDVAPTKNHDTVCIEVDSPSHLFLCGESMTPTHNSTYGSVVAPTWAMGKYPGLKIILASYGSDLAKKHGRRARQIARSSEYKSIFNTTISSDTAAADEWAVTNGSEYLACGILSGITGNRANGLIIDDPIKGRQDADSETVRARTWDVYQEDLRTRLVPGGWEIIIQTRWHENDLAGRILPENYNGESGLIRCRDGRDWFIACLPAQCDRTDDPIGRAVGEYLWPGWFTEEHFAPFKAQARTWNALFQQRPQPEEGTYFQRDWFHRYRAQEKPEFLHIYGASDYAVSDDSGDFTDHAVLGIDERGHIWVLDWWKKQATSDVWIDSQLDLIQKYSPFCWFEEAGVIKRAIRPFQERRMQERQIYCRHEWIPSVADKPTRARGFQARAASGMVHVPEGEIGDYLIDQFIRFPSGAHDDAVDCMSLFCMALDQAHPAIVNIAPKPKKLSDARIDFIEKNEGLIDPTEKALIENQRQEDIFWNGFEQPQNTGRTYSDADGR